MRLHFSIASYPLIFLFILITAQCSSKNSDQLVEDGIEFSKKGNYEKALKSFLKATKLDSNNPEAFYGLGGIYNLKNNYDEAAQAFQKVIKLDPTHFNARYSLGFTYEKMGKSEQAKKEYERYRSLKNRFETMVKKEQRKN